MLLFISFLMDQHFFYAIFGTSCLLEIHIEGNEENDVRATDKEESASFTNTILTFKI